MAMKSILQFDKTFTGKMANIKTRFSPKEAETTVHAPSNVRSGFATDVKLWNLVRGMNEEGGSSVFIGHTKDNTKGYCEITQNGETQCCAVILNHASKEIRVSAATMNESGVMTPYDADSRRGSVVCGAVIGLFSGFDREITNCLDSLEQWIVLDENADDWDDPITASEFGKKINLLSNNLYYQLKGYDLDLSIKTFRAKERKDILPLLLPFTKTNPVGFDYGSDSKNESLKLEVGKYSIVGNRVFTDEEKALIPNLPSSYIMPAWCATVCEEIMDSSVFSEPFRNILLTGPAGTGKTFGAKAIAQSLGLPYVKYTCDPDTDLISIVGQMLPNTSSTTYPTDIPTFDDVANDFKGSFRKLFDREAGPLDCDADCYNEIYKRLSTEKADFTYVESDFIKAIRNGWLVEIQEPTVIKRSSVLVGLNAIMENNADSSITLPTGEVIKRHPHAIVVMTTNSDYDGCNKIQQSVLSRAELVRKIPNPEAEVLAERTMKATGWKDKKLMEKMARTMLEASLYCQEKDIRDGISGPRELLNWTKATILRQARKDGNKPFESAVIDEDVLMEAAFSTVFEKLSQTEEDVEDVLTGVFQKYFDQSIIEMAKQQYLLGVA